MFDVGFSELILVFVIGLIVLGPKRLPVAVKTVVGWIRAMRSLASNVQNELLQEMRLQELQDSLKKVEEASKTALPPELQESMAELKKTADAMTRNLRGDEYEKAEDEANISHIPTNSDQNVAPKNTTPADSETAVHAPATVPPSEHLVPSASSSSTTSSTIQSGNEQ